MNLMSKKIPSGNRDKEGQDTVAPFRAWRGFLAFNPRPLTETRQCHAESEAVNENFGKIHETPCKDKKSPLYSAVHFYPVALPTCWQPSKFTTHK